MNALLDAGEAPAVPVRAGPVKASKHYQLESVLRLRHHLVTIHIEGEDTIQLHDDLLAIPTPGHTRGHLVFLYRKRFLFTGDHLAWSPARQTLTAFPSVAWYSWARQTESMAKLARYDFEWVLPGHGSQHHDTKPNMRYHLQSCIAWMKSRR